MNGRLYIDNGAGEGFKEQERGDVLDSKTGKVLWEQRFNVFHADIASSRLGWTHLVGDPVTGNIYWHGTQGNLVGFNKDGKILWQRQLMEMDGRVSGYGGRLPSPTLAGDLVVIGMINSGWADQGKGANRFLAVNKLDGTPVWWSQTSERPGTYFSTPVTATINGQHLIITGCSDGGIHALQAGTGKNMWSYVFCKGAINCSPAVDGTLVYANHGEETPGTNVQGRIICVDAGAVTDGHPKLVWELGGIQAKYTSPLVQGGRVFIADDVAKLWCFEAKTGKKIWNYPYGRNAMASPVWGDGKIYVSEKNAKFHILQPGAKKCETLDEHFFPEASGADVELYGNAAIADGLVYFPTRDELYCIGTKDAKSGPPAATPAPPSRQASRHSLLIYPSEVVAHAGDSVPLRLKVYDENGDFIQEVGQPANAKWSLPQPPLPPGAQKVSRPAAGEFRYCRQCEIGPQQGPCRPARLCRSRMERPQGQGARPGGAGLPYSEDFEKTPVGGVPPGWINCQGKFLVRKLPDGNNVLAKVTSSSNAVIARGSCFFGTPDMTNYTIEADVQGQKINEWMPDAGVGACRYLLKLEGQTQTLRLQSWDAIPRVDRVGSLEMAAGHLVSIETDGHRGQGPHDAPG